MSIDVWVVCKYRGREMVNPVQIIGIVKRNILTELDEIVEMLAEEDYHCDPNNGYYEDWLHDNFLTDNDDNNKLYEEYRIKELKNLATNLVKTSSDTNVIPCSINSYKYYVSKSTMKL